MKATKQLIVCLTVCLVLSFVSTVYAGPPIELRHSTPVTVVNPDSKPVPVTEVNKYPIQKQVVEKFDQSLVPWSVIATIYEVPVDKRLVIEYFSCRSRSGSYSTSYSCSISTGNYPDRVEHYLPSTPYGHPFIPIQVNPEGIINNEPTNFPSYMSAGQRMQIYAEPGTTVLVEADRQIQGLLNFENYPEEYMQFSFSGYLLDIAP